MAGLDYVDPLFDPHAALQRFKQHPFVRELLRGGHLVRFGAKALPEGGWNTQPTLYADGALIAGDAANFVNSMRLKGIHLAMRSGMLAAETAFDAVRAGDTSATRLQRYKAAVDTSAIRAELYPVRNVHQAFAGGLFAGSIYAGLTMATNGQWPGELEGHAGHTRMATLDTYYGLKKRDILGASNAVAPNRVLTFDKATSVHHWVRITRRTSRSICWCTPTSATRCAAPSTGTRACGSARPTSTNRRRRRRWPPARR